VPRIPYLRVIVAANATLLSLHNQLLIVTSSQYVGWLLYTYHIKQF